MTGDNTGKKPTGAYIWVMATISVLLIVVDQLVKRWALNNLEPDDITVIIDGWFEFVLVLNQGAVFGLMQGGRWLFIPLTSVVVTALAIFYVLLPRTREQIKIRVAMLLIFAGAVGNFIDRLKNENGYVVDLFRFPFDFFPFVFNVADICLVMGTIVLAFIVIFLTKDKHGA